MDNAAEKGASVSLSTVVGEAEKEGSKCKKKKNFFFLFILLSGKATFQRLKRKEDSPE